MRRRLGPETICSVPDLHAILIVLYVGTLQMVHSQIDDAKMQFLYKPDVIRQLILQDFTAPGTIYILHKFYFVASPELIARSFYGYPESADFLHSQICRTKTVPSNTRCVPISVELDLPTSLPL